MTKYEELHFICNLLLKAKPDKSVDLCSPGCWKDLLFTDQTRVGEDYLSKLNDEGILYYEEIGEDGFAPIVMCSIKDETADYLKKIVTDLEFDSNNRDKAIADLNKRICEILTFDPKRLSQEIDSTELIISKTKHELESNPILHPLKKQLELIELHFKSISKVSQNYEEIYKNIILPVRDEGRAGVRQTVKWAIIGIIVSSLFSVFISWATN